MLGLLPVIMPARSNIWIRLQRKGGLERDMRSRLYLLLAALLLVAAVIPMTGCGGGGQEAAYSSMARYWNEPIKVGALFAVTGVYAPLGDPEKKTAEMMAEQINNAGGINGHPLELVIYDTESDTTKCSTLATKLIEQDKVVAIIGPTSTGETMAILDTVTKAGIPLIACAAAEEIVTDTSKNPPEVREWVFMTPQTSDQAVQRIFDYLQQKGIKNIAIITDAAGFGVLGKKALVAEAPNYGLTIVASQEFQNDTSLDPTPQLQNIENATPSAEAVICWGTNPGPAIIATKMKERGMTIPLYNSHGIANKTFITTAGEAANGVIFPGGKLLVADKLLDSNPQKAVLIQYRQDFETKYGAGTANTFGGHAYDALSMVVMALREVGPDKTAMRDYIQTITNFVGISGIFNMSAENHQGLTKEAFVLIEIKNGQWTWLQ